MEKHPRIARDAGVAGVSGGDVARRGSRGRNLGGRACVRAQCREPVLADAIDPRPRELLAQRGKRGRRFRLFARGGESVRRFETVLADCQRAAGDPASLLNGDLSGQPGERWRLGLGQSPIRGGGALAKKTRAHVALLIESIAAFAAPAHVDLRDDDFVGLFPLGEDGPRGRNDHRAAAPVGDRDVHEVLHGARAKGGAADVAVADGGSAHRGVEDDVGAAERQAAGGLGEDHVVADEKPDSPQVGRLKYGEGIAALPALLADGQVDLVVASDFLAVAAEQEGRIA
jgi:hypothetical protein